MTQLYQDLGVPPNASSEEIKRAFKKKAAETHPDKGGNSESFQIVQHAYSVLKDPNRRAQYDASGEDKLVDEGALIRQTLAQIFLAVVEATADPAYTDILAQVRQRVQTGQAQVKEQKKVIQARVKKLQKAAKLLKRKGKKDADFLQQVLAAQIATLENSLQQTEKQAEIGKRMLEMLEDYTYSFEKGGAVHNPFAGFVPQVSPSTWRRV